MGSFPEDAAALPASLEVVVEFGGAARDEFCDLIFRNLFQQAVASQTACKRLYGSRQIETAYDFGELATTFGLSQPVAVRNIAALQKAAIAREQDPILPARDFHQLPIS